MYELKNKKPVAIMFLIVLASFSLMPFSAVGEKPDPKISMLLNITTLIFKDQFAEAIQELTIFIDTHPNDPDKVELIARRAQVKILAGNQPGGQQEYREILPSLDRKVTEHPTNAHLYYFRGMAHKALNEREKAITDFKKTLELKPTYTEAKMNLLLLGEE